MDRYPPCKHPYDGWFVDSTSLTRHGFLVADFVESTPPRRGTDVTAARRPGRLYQRKVYDPRVQSLVIWALKADEFGNVLGGAERNLDRLKLLFGGGLKQVELTRRMTLPFGRVSTRKADVELVEALDGRRTALTQTGTYVQFAVDLLFADPYWYEETNSVVDQPSDYGSFVIWNPGTVQHFDAIVRIYGPAVDPELVCETTGTRVKYDGTIAYGDYVELNSYDFTVVDDAGVSVAGNVERDQVYYVELAPGRNVLTLSDGTCDVSWRPAFL